MLFLCREVMKKIRAHVGMFHNNTFIDEEYVRRVCVLGILATLYHICKGVCTV